MKCPSCRKRLAGKKLGRKYLGIQTKTERRYTIDSPAGDFSYAKEIPVTYEEYQDEYICKACGYKWTQIESRSGSPFTKSKAGMS